MNILPYAKSCVGNRQLRTALAVLGRRQRRKLAMLIHDDPLVGGPVRIVKHGEKIF
jgi:hypothetical protein